jgi:hypothetical protein
MMGGQVSFLLERRDVTRIYTIEVCYKKILMIFEIKMRVFYIHTGVVEWRTIKWRVRLTCVCKLPKTFQAAACLCSRRLPSLPPILDLILNGSVLKRPATTLPDAVCTATK